MKKKKIIKKYGPAIIWAGIIFILSSVPGNDYPNSAFNYSILAHIGEYFILAILLAYALNKNKLFWIFIIGVLYALSDEVHQLFVPYRSCSVVDFLADVLAIILGIIIWKNIWQNLDEKRT